MLGRVRLKGGVEVAVIDEFLEQVVDPGVDLLEGCEVLLEVVAHRRPSVGLGVETTVEASLRIVVASLDGRGCIWFDDPVFEVGE